MSIKKLVLVYPFCKDLLPSSGSFIAYKDNRQSMFLHDLLWFFFLFQECKYWKSMKIQNIFYQTNHDWWTFVQQQDIILTIVILDVKFHEILMSNEQWKMNV